MSILNVLKHPIGQVVLLGTSLYYSANLCYSAACLSCSAAYLCNSAATLCWLEIIRSRRAANIGSVARGTIGGTVLEPPAFESCGRGGTGSGGGGNSWYSSLSCHYHRLMAAQTAAEALTTQHL